jgi:6-phosphofructokinase
MPIPTSQVLAFSYINKYSNKPGDDKKQYRLTATKKLDSLVLVFVLIELSVVTQTRTSTLNNLCVIGGDGSLMPMLEYIDSTNTILKMARVAGIVATIHDHAAIYPHTSP